MFRRSLIIVVITFLAALSSRQIHAEDPATSALGEPTFSPAQIEFFESDVRPVLVEHCFDCHSSDAKELKAKLYVDSREGIITGGESGPAIVVGNPNESELIAAVRYESTEMPPDGKLSNKDINSLVKWVEMGAPWPQVTASPGVPVVKEVDWDKADWSEIQNSHWAWQPVIAPEVPDVGDDRNAAGPIDKFIIARRTSAGLNASPPAPLDVLARRLYLDLIGIVPSPQQMKLFLAAAQKDREQALQQLINELLASDEYGERWARHWLDVARYSDGHGGFLDSDKFDAAWRYRDWVVAAMNDDMPIDKFIRLQVAGDLIGDYQDAVATGFFALGPTYRSDGGDPDATAQAKSETLDDRIDTLSRGLMGVTASCARCHDHKFDPIPQTDYYSLAGVFNNTASQKVPLAEREIVEAADQHRKAIDERNKKIKEIDQKAKKEKREPTEEERTQRQTLETERKALQDNPPPKYETAHALRDSGDKDMHVAIRGNLRKTGELAPRRFPRLLAGGDPPRFEQGSGRMELADAIVDPRNPLTARVFVNRIWKHHFGAGLVRTPSNFGTLGEPPTHPKLLDWLTADFVEHGWSLKQLHRQIVNSITYQQSSAHDESAFTVDGDNRWLWRHSPRRMDVEAWRDSLLSVTGELDLTKGGPSLSDITRNRRRTFYAKVSRNGDVFESDAFLRRFDFPTMRATVAKRSQSVVPQQFLFLLNSQFMVDRAKALVERLNNVDDGLAKEDRITRAYRLLYNRDPDASELKIGREFVRQTTSDKDGKLTVWDQYAQVLLSSNEFMYVR